MINLRKKIMREKVDRSKQMMYFFSLKFNLICLENKKWHDKFKKKRKIVEDYMQEKRKEKRWNPMENGGRKKEIE